MLAVLVAVSVFLAGIAFCEATYIGSPMNVEFDGRSFKINGERQLFIAGSFHYPRAPRSEWGSIFRLAKENGVNLIQTYVFWDIHEPENNLWNFPSDPTSNEDLVAFIQEAAKNDLYVHLRIAGYVCAEWNFGGLPIWLRNLNATLRTYDEVWFKELSQFMEKTLEVVKNAQLMASQGGPIIMLQIENEYGNMEDYYGVRGKKYVDWLNDYALKLDVGNVPWIMCQQGEGVGTAPSASIINTCNGFYCDNWISSHANAFPNQPHMWTENWPGWFQNWGQPIPHRPTVDVAFSVARWFARGGSYMNYYMLYGGTTFARQVGGPLIVTSYDYDVHINEYSLKAEPKFSSSQRLHQLLTQYAGILLNQMPPAGETLPADAHCESHRYSSDVDSITFYSNWGEENTCSFLAADGVSTIVVPAWSVSIAVGLNHSQAVYNTKDTTANEILANEKSYSPVSTFKLSQIRGQMEPIPSMEGTSVTQITTDAPLEQLSLTNDTTDYVWYSSSFTIPSSINGSSSKFPFEFNLAFDAGSATGSMFFVYIDGVYVASTFGATGPLGEKIPTSHAGISSMEIPKEVKMNAGNSAKGSYYPPAKINIPFFLYLNSDVNHEYHVDILSVSMGLKNYGPYLETIQSGIVSPIVCSIVNTDFKVQFASIVHSVGLQGPTATIPSSTSNRSCEPNNRKTNGLCWFTASFETPPLSHVSNETPVALAYALNLGTSMGKGMVFVNGHMLGRYWNVLAKATDNQRSCQDVCSSEAYVGSYSGDRCRLGCDQPSQEYYKLPRDWLFEDGKPNTLLLMEEIGGDLSQLQLFEVSMVTASVNAQ